MTRIWSRLLVACGMLSAIGSAAAFDPLRIDILRLRLGMHEGEVVNILAAQGVSGSRLQRDVQLCQDRSDAVCVTRLRGRTGDGMLTIDFGAPRADTGQPAVNVIQYRLDGRQPGEPAAIRTAVLDRFGPPSSREPLAWCEQVNPEGLCPADRPRLVYLPGPGISSLLLLSDGSTMTKP